MAFDLGGKPKSFGGTEFGAAELSCQKDSGDDRSGAGAKTNAEWNVVLHVELHGRKRCMHRGGCTLHGLDDQITGVTRNLVRVRAAIGALELGFSGLRRSAEIKIQRNCGAIESSSYISAGSGNDNGKNALA